MQAICMFLCSFLLYSGMTNAMEIVPWVQVVDNDTKMSDDLPINADCLALRIDFLMINRLSLLLPSEKIFGKTYLPYLRYIPAEIFAQKIVPILLNSEKFWLYTGEKGSNEDEIEKSEKAFDNINLDKDKKSHDTVIDIIPRSLSSNLDQLKNLNFQEKKILAKKILKFVEYSSKPLASKCNPLIERHLLKAALVHILDHCSNDFRILSNQEKQNFLLPELIEQFKEIFGFMSWNEKKQAVGCMGIYINSELQFAARGLYRLDTLNCVHYPSDDFFKYLYIIIGIFVPLIIAIMPISITGPEPFMIIVTTCSLVFILIECILYGSGWAYNMHRIHDLDDALLELEEHHQETI